MQKFNYIFIGGGIASTKAAEYARKIDPNGSMAIISEEPETLYSRLNLPHFLKDIIPVERLYLRDDKWYEDNNIILFKGKRVTKVQTNPKQITIGNEEALEYEKLLIGTGGTVNLWQLRGADLPGVFYLRTIDDARRIKEWLDKAKHGVIIGAGFIGLEFSTTFARHNISADFLVKDDYYWSSMLDQDQGELLSQMLEAKGIKIWTREETKEVLGNQKVEKVRTISGKEIETDVVGVGIGIHNELYFLDGSGIKTNRGVITNEYFETNIPGIYAAGDVAEFYDVIFNRQHQLGNWANAQVQGQIAGNNIALYDKQSALSDKQKYETVSAYSIQVFDGNVSFVGVPRASEKTKIIKRGTLSDEAIGKILVEDGRVVGAALVNRVRESTQIGNLIKNKVNIEGKEDKLSDPAFDLTTLL